MKQEKATSWQTIWLLVMFLFGSAAIFGVSSVAEQDSWFAFFVSALCSVPVLLIYGRLNKLFPQTGLFALTEQLLGKVLGKIVIALMGWYCLHLCALVLRNFSEFVEVCMMPETPQLATMLLMMLVVVYMARSGVECMGKWALFALPVVMLVVAFTVVASVNIIDLSRIQPVLSHDVGTIAEGAYMFLSFPFLETVVFVCAFQGFIAAKKRPYRPYLFGLLIGAVLLAVADIRNTLVLGTPLLHMTNFPSFVASKIIRVGDLISRLEGSIAMNYIVCGIVKISIALMAAGRATEHLFNLKKSYKNMLLPLGLLAVALSVALYESGMEMYNFLDIYKIYAVPFQVAFPLLIWILAEIKAKKERSKQQKEGATLPQ